MSDSEIVTQILAGNSSGFEALLRRYAPMVRGLCASHVYDPSALDDLVQESFVAGYVNLHTLRDRRKFGPWIAQITRNKCQSWLRERVREERGHDRLKAEPLPNATPDPLSQLARKELCEWVRTQIGSLPDKTREAMLLCYVEGLKIREAAQFLDASESSIKKRLQYGRDQLGEKIWNELGDLKRPASDEQPLCKKVMAALPLTSAPWQVGGTTAAATSATTLLAGKAGVIGITLAALAIAFGLVAWNERPRQPLGNGASSVSATNTANANSENENAEAEDPGVARAPASTLDTGDQEKKYVVDTVSAIRGILRDADTGEPIVGEPVQISGDLIPHDYMEQFSDQFGRFNFETANFGYGPYSLRCGGRAYATQSSDEVRDPGVPDRHDIALTRLGVVSGHVYTYDGKPAEGAVVYRADPTRTSWFSVDHANADGTYSATHDGGNVVMRASGDASESEEVMLDLVPSEPATQDFTLEPAANAYFNIRTEEGAVPEEFAKDGLIHHHSFHNGGVLKREGDIYFLRQLVPGIYYLLFETEGYSPKLVEFTMGDDLQDEHISVLLDHAGAGLTVAVVDEFGRPVTDTMVHTQLELRWYDPTDDEDHERSAPLGSQSTRSDGYAQFKGLPIGEYTVEAKGVRETVTVPRSGVFTIEVPSEDPPPGPDSIYVHQRHIELIDTKTNRELNTEHAAIVAITPSGRANSGDIEVGDNLLYVVRSGYPFGVSTVSITPEFMAQAKKSEVFVEDRIRVEIPPKAGEAYGVVMKADGTPVPGRPILVLPKTLERFAGNSENSGGYYQLGGTLAQGAQSDEAGAFELPYLADGDYYICTSPGNMVERGVLVQVEPGQSVGPINLVVP